MFCVLAGVLAKIRCPGLAHSPHLGENNFDVLENFGGEGVSEGQTV